MDGVHGMLNRASLPFLRLLCNLRWLAVIGQAAAIILATGPMHIALVTAPLWAGTGSLALFNVYAMQRVRQGRDPEPAEIFVHMLFDILILTWMIFWSGGIENPFSSLFLLPIALSILALPAGWTWATAVAGGIGYGISAWFGSELPHVHGAFGDAFSLHKLGMLANFVVSAAVVLFFFTRMAAAWRHSEREVASLRERFTRNEGILALATHAASVAHELNTPLGTLTLMVDDLLHESGTDEQREDYATMKALLEVCRDRVRELAAPAESESRHGGAARVDLERVIERWQLVRPTIELHRTGTIAGHEKVDPAVGHLLQALLNNAADAGEQANVLRVDLDLHADGTELRGAVRDYGVGFKQAQPVLPATLFRTSKPDGLGIGLALSHATVERLGGELSMQAPQEGRGVRISFRLPATRS